jgi:nicotinate-nucleotide pyrophosphorylase (carboxylating)
MTNRTDEIKPAQDLAVLKDQLDAKSRAELSNIIDAALAEDIGAGDLTGSSVIPEDSVSTASLVLKEGAVIAGLHVFELVMKRCDPNFKIELLADDSQQIEKTPFNLARMKGSSRALLAGERTALNLIQRMSGIATMTRQFVDLAQNSNIEILDTRKTTPGLRVIEKWAVRLGAGVNHRFGLYDAILIKDNHRAIAGGVAPSIKKARLNAPGVPIEIEVNTLEQLSEALDLGVERVMLDNMSSEDIKKAVAIVNGRAYIEVSGGVNQKNIQNYLIPGVNGISIGALTHSVKSIDISLEFEG